MPEAAAPHPGRVPRLAPALGVGAGARRQLQAVQRLRGARRAGRPRPRPRRRGAALPLARRLPGPAALRRLALDRHLQPRRGARLRHPGGARPLPGPDARLRHRPRHQLGGRPAARRRQLLRPPRRLLPPVRLPPAGPPGGAAPPLRRDRRAGRRGRLPHPRGPRRARLPAQVVAGPGAAGQEHRLRDGDREPRRARSRSWSAPMPRGRSRSSARTPRSGWPTSKPCAARNGTRRSPSCRRRAWRR